MTTLTIRLSAKLKNGDVLYQETTLDQTLYTDKIMVDAYHTMAPEFATYLKSQSSPPAP